MADYRVEGDILLESTGESAAYDVIMEDWDFPPSPMDVLAYLLEIGDIQIIPTHWEEVED